MCVLYGAGVAGVAAAGLAPDAYRAGVSLAWCACVLPLVQLLGPMPGLAWLAPAYLLKLVGSHAAPLPTGEQSWTRGALCLPGPSAGSVPALQTTSIPAPSLSCI